MIDWLTVERDSVATKRKQVTNWRLSFAVHAYRARRRTDTGVLAVITLFVACCKYTHQHTNSNHHQRCNILWAVAGKTELLFFIIFRRNPINIGSYVSCQMDVLCGRIIFLIHWQRRCTFIDNTLTELEDWHKMNDIKKFNRYSKHNQSGSNRRHSEYSERCQVLQHSQTT